MDRRVDTNTTSSGTRVGFACFVGCSQYFRLGIEVQFLKKSEKVLADNRPFPISDDSSQHRKRFEKHRKQHYNEFQVVRLRKQEIEAELHALEQEEATATGSEEQDSQAISSSSSNDSIKPILIPQHARNSLSSSHHVHVEDDHQYDVDVHLLTPEEQERRKQFELKRRNHYNEFRAAHLTDQDDEK
ncbi:unnamed protein product [Rotaria socialis]|uniref:Uncharacterized protein n=1 Tax=Rotaria socialis TaxID=392032 RepID=A0A821Q7U7_9BILA|nr:unnamed protein product [Rotaria socialis]